MEKDKKSAVLGVILSLCILAMWNLMAAEPVHASEGSLLIEAHYKKDDGTSVTIPEDYYSIYKVAHVEKDAYTNVSPFQDFPLIERDSANSEKNQLVHSLEEYVTSHSLLPEQEGYTDQKGMLSFHHLDEGLYFIRKNPKAAGNQMDYRCDSFLLELPLDTSDGPLYAVKVRPKYTPEGGDHSTVFPPSEDVQTGDPLWDTPWFFILAASGMILLFLKKKHYAQ